MRAATVFVAVALSAVSLASADEKLVFSVLLHRHGDRSPTECFPLDVDPDCSHWTDGFGMLTATGGISCGINP